MKCPRCNGTGIKSQWSPGIMQPDGTFKTIVVACPHCDSTGEIQNDDWWMCTSKELGGELPLMFDNGEWCYAATYYSSYEIEPIRRMVEVE